MNSQPERVLASRDELLPPRKLFEVRIGSLVRVVNILKVPKENGLIHILTAPENLQKPVLHKDGRSGFGSTGTTPANQRDSEKGEQDPIVLREVKHVFSKRLGAPPLTITCRRAVV
jgi:hypothetical protein